MVVNYAQAFALADDPFGPKKGLKGVPPTSMDELDRNPLWLHEAPLLESLYCDALATFKKATSEFESDLDVYGYSLDPPGFGTSSIKVLVVGDLGTGKSTLASRLVLMLSKCAPAGFELKTTTVRLVSKTQVAAEQLEKIKTGVQKVLDASTKEDRCCLLLDDLREDAIEDAVEIHREMREQRVTCLFLTTRATQLAKSPWSKTTKDFATYSTSPISEDEAIAFILKRLGRFRLSTAAGNGHYGLFPFEEDDIRSAIRTKGIKELAGFEPITLRMLGRNLSDALLRKAKELTRSGSKIDARTFSEADLAAAERIEIAKTYSILV